MAKRVQALRTGRIDHKAMDREGSREVNCMAISKWLP